MRKKVSIVVLCAVLIMGLCGCGVKNQIVGKWEMGDPNNIINYEFTSDNKVILDQCNDDGTWVRWEYTYELKEGRLLRTNGTYTANGVSTKTDDQLPVIYNVNGDTLTLEALSHLGKAQFTKVDEFTYKNPNII